MTYKEKVLKIIEEMIVQQENGSYSFTLEKCKLCIIYRRPLEESRCGRCIQHIFNEIVLCPCEIQSTYCGAGGSLKINRVRANFWKSILPDLKKVDAKYFKPSTKNKHIIFKPLFDHHNSIIS